MFRFLSLLLMVALGLCAAEKSGILSKKDLEKRKLSRLEGMVTDIGKFPISEASVTVQRMEDNGNTPLRVELKTAADGRFLLDALVPGTYVVEASHTGFKAAKSQYSLVPGKVAKASLSLSLTYR